ncbi:MAG TPA: hypothetical protein VLZ10_11310 [Thermodesulfobacteriota bacterium]|nr:hypothetical protein [Thermodesulfobacteriota bacterium]
MANDRILLILEGEDNGNAEESAFNYARSTSKKLVVLQILTSNLYHYGHQDIVATRPSKRQFLLHIRNEVLEQGRAKVKVLEEKAGEQGIAIEIHSVESEDICSAAVEEARKGYDAIFLARKKRKVFPLLEKGLAQHLRKKIRNTIVES